MLQAPQCPKFGFAFLQFLLIILFSGRVALDRNLRERDGMDRFVQLSVAERIGVHGLFSAA